MIKLKQLYEAGADPAKVDPKRFPKKLSAVDQKAAAKYVTQGQKDNEPDDDIIAVDDDEPTVVDLKPSQTSMNNPKAMSFVVRALNQGEPFEGTDVLKNNAGDLGAFTSNDGHIMDGHHRWIAVGMVNPKAKLKVNKIDFPSDQLIGILNALTKGAFNIPKGKEASGGFEQFARGPIEGKIDDVIANGTSFGDSPEVVKAAFTKLIGKEGETVDDETLAKETKAKITSNIGSLNFTLPPGAPERPDMPVISKKAGHVKQAIDALKGGDIDIVPPYATVEDGYDPKTRRLWKAFNTFIIKEYFQKTARIK